MKADKVTVEAWQVSRGPRLRPLAEQRDMGPQPYTVSATLRDGSVAELVLAPEEQTLDGVLAGLNRMAGVLGEALQESSAAIFGACAVNVLRDLGIPGPKGLALVQRAGAWSFEVREPS